MSAIQGTGRQVVTGSVLERMLAQNEQSLLTGEPFNMRDMRTNAILNDDEWQLLDTQMLFQAEERLVIVDDLRAAGLTVPLDSLGILEIEHERMDVFTPAEQSMSGTNRTQFDLPEKDFVFTPVPITHKDFQLEARAVMSSRRRGAPLDTTGLQLATRQVVEKLEDMVVNGGDINLNGNTIPGLATHADRNTHTISTAWDGVATNDLIIDDILAMIQLAEDDNMGGPFNLYYPKNYSTVFDEDYGDAVTTFPTTLRQRVEAISRVASVKQADVLADDNVLMVQMTSDVIDLPVAQEITTVDWETQGGWVTNFKVFAAMTVRVKSDKAGQSGVVHGSV